MRSVWNILFVFALAFANVSMPVRAAGDWDVSPTPLDKMKEAGVSDNSDDISRVLLDTDQDVQLRYVAAMSLGQLADKSAIPTLIASLSDSNETVRAGAAAALRYFPGEKSVQPLCRTALGDANMAPRHEATTALSSNNSEQATKCLVRVAANEQETQKVRLHSLIILEQQIAFRTGFEELIPTLQDPDPTVKGMAANILSRVYESDPHLLESLSVLQILIEAVTDPRMLSWIYIGAVERLEQIAGRQFIEEIEVRYVMEMPEGRGMVNGRIESWADKEFASRQH